MTESRADMLDRHLREDLHNIERHARELAELESRSWEERFTEDPYDSWHKSMKTPEWIKQTLPTIIRKREKIGVTVHWFDNEPNPVITWGYGESVNIHKSLANKLAGRTLAPGEKVEI